MTPTQAEIQPAATPALPASSLEKFDDQLTPVLPVLTALALLGFIYYSVTGSSAAPIDIVASTVLAPIPGGDSAWIVSGRTVRRADATPVAARVWIVAVDARGNRYMPPAQISDAGGGYTLPPIPRVLGGDRDLAVSATISAAIIDTAGTTITGEESIRLSSTGRLRRLDPPSWPFLLIAGLFALTVWLALHQRDRMTPQRRRARYQVLVAFSFVFTFLMLMLLVIGLRRISAGVNPGDVISLGFANVYQGSYVKGGTPEWLFSLTSPTNNRDILQAEIGLGAPLWTILISVLGAAIFTISLLVKHVKEPMNPEDEKSYRERIEELVRHQFYIFFAPFGALLVYQLLVAGNAATAPVTVAFAILAAGTAMNLLLDKAVNTLQGTLK